MTSKNPHSLQLIIPRAVKSKIDKLVLPLRTYSVMNQTVMLETLRQQDSIIYKWIFGSTIQRDSKKNDIVGLLNNEYFTDYYMVVE